MKITLRPYHPTGVIAIIGGAKMTGFNNRGVEYVIAQIMADPDLDVEIVHEYDDICKRCDRRIEDERGSVWGERHTCPSAQDQKMIEKVNSDNQRFFSATGLSFGSVMKMRDLVGLLKEKIPPSERGGPEGPYAKGLAKLSEMYGERASSQINTL
ncbi:MAG: DUF1284 domain-containing protein [Planctomycetota bacterium]